MVIKNKVIFYLLSCIWGSIMTLIGLLTTVILLIAGYKPKVYGHCLHFEVGNNWGGVNLGPVFLTNKNSSEHTKMHEHGHGFQNALLGPLFPFIVAIPSSIRYWLRTFNTQKKKFIFSIAVYTSLFVISVILALIAPITAQGLFILAILLVLYAACLLYWLVFIEIPKYEEETVAYDDIWFERTATKFGKDFINNN